MSPIPPQFSFPHDSRLLSSDFNIPKLKVMASKKAPLWVETVNAQTQGTPFLTIFKFGDDLRQDILTLQLIRVFDKWWLEKGLDFRMKPYRVMSTMD
jgi:phosphatidylinositol-4,5-bisphosphate 3-kinase catalytic subunit alpha/beta/delta